MSRPKNKDEYRKELADMFANILSEKGLMWKKDWIGMGGNAPQNAVTKVNYRGCNYINLILTAVSRGFSDPRWATMVQIMDKDNKYHPNQKWHLKAGSKAVYVEYWYPFDLVNKTAMTWSKYDEAITKEQREPEEFKLSTRYTAVFNATDIEGITDFVVDEHPKIIADDIINTLSKEMGVDILYDGGDRAYYSPSEDRSHLPALEFFTSEYGYNSTALHELAHSSGHPSRLNRRQGAFFGTPEYAYEELIAEITSCFMGVNLEFEPSEQHINNHKAYVQSWVKMVTERPDTLVKAIKEAQTATNYMEYKAGIIPEKEYQKNNATVREFSTKKPMPEVSLSI